MPSRVVKTKEGALLAALHMDKMIYCPLGMPLHAINYEDVSSRAYLGGPWLKKNFAILLFRKVKTKKGALLAVPHREHNLVPLRVPLYAIKYENMPLYKKNVCNFPWVPFQLDCFSALYATSTSGLRVPKAAFSSRENGMQCCIRNFDRWENMMNYPIRFSTNGAGPPHRIKCYAVI